MASSKNVLGSQLRSALTRTNQSKNRKNQKPGKRATNNAVVRHPVHPAVLHPPHLPHLPHRSLRPIANDTKVASSRTAVVDNPVTIVHHENIPAHVITRNDLIHQGIADRGMMGKEMTGTVETGTEKENIPEAGARTISEDTATDDQ